MSELTVVSAAPLNSGGIGRVTYNWARVLADRGRSVRVICPGHNDADTSGFDVQRLSSGRFSYYWKDLYYSLKVRLRGTLEGEVLSWLGLGTFFDTDVVHMGSVPRPLQQRRLAEAGVTKTDTDLRARVDNVCFSVYDYHRRLLHRAPRIVVPSPEIAETIDWYGEGLAEKTTVVPHGVSESFLSEGSDRREQVLFVGGTMPRKGISTLLSAWRAYDGPETLIVAGYGDDAAFRELREEHGVSPDRVEYVGFVSDDRLRELYRESRAFVLPSYEEGFGIPVLEALAAGTPVICTDVVGSRFVVEESGGGATVPPGDADALREALGELLDGDWRGAGAAGREHVAANYLWKHVVADLEDAVFES